MRSGHAVKISFSLKGLAVKTLLSRLVIYLITAVLILICAHGALIPIIEDASFVADFKSLGEVFRTMVYDFFSPEVATNITSTELNNKILAVLSHFTNNMAGIIWSALAIFIISQIAVFCASVCDYVIAINVNNYMTTLMHCTFFSTLFENFGKALKYGLYKTTMLLLYNSIVWLICYLLSLLFLNLFNKVGLFFISLILFVTITLRFSVSGHVLPKMICENKGPFKSLFECVSEVCKDIMKLFDRFGVYFLVIIAIFVINVVCAVFTLLVSLLITLPLSVLIFSSIKFVGYYTEHKMKYFITYDEIYIPKELRQNDEKLLNKIDI